MPASLSRIMVRQVECFERLKGATYREARRGIKTTVGSVSSGGGPRAHARPHWLRKGGDDAVLREKRSARLELLRYYETVVEVVLILLLTAAGVRFLQWYSYAASCKAVDEALWVG